MADFIGINPSPDLATVDAMVCLSRDDTFVISLEAEAKSNEHGTPPIWSEIEVDAQVIGRSPQVASADGFGSVVISDAVQPAKGQICKIRSASGNTNADADPVKMELGVSNTACRRQGPSVSNLKAQGGTYVL